jgi:hypothetical protein
MRDQAQSAFLLHFSYSQEARVPGIAENPCYH